MMMVRIIKAQKESVPQSIEQKFSTETLQLDESAEQKAEKVYSLRDKVIEDLKKLAAMETTKSKADEFILQVVRDGWQGAIDKFNKLYGQEQKKTTTDPNTFELNRLTDVQRISKEKIETLIVQNQGDPTAQLLIDMGKREKRFIEKLYALVPQDATVLDAVPLIVEFKPDMSYYCLKNLSVKPLEKAQYEKFKAMQAYRENIIQSQSLAVVHFSPENILKRMNFRAIKEEVPAESEGKL